MFRRPLSDAQEEALFQLVNGCPFGRSVSAVRGLMARGLVEVRPTLMRSGDVLDLPWLTVKGLVIAKAIDRRRREAAGARPTGRFAGARQLQVVDGGRR